MRTLSLVLLLLAMPNLAHAWGPILGAESAYLSPGPMLTRNWRENQGWGFGLELSAYVIRNEMSMLGILTQWQHETRAERFMLGLEAGAVMGGVELGAVLRKPSRDDVQVGLHTALFGSFFGMFNLGPRFVVWGEGLEIGLVMSGKIPIKLVGRGPFDPAGKPWGQEVPEGARP